MRLLLGFLRRWHALLLFVGLVAAGVGLLSRWRGVHRSVVAGGTTALAGRIGAGATEVQGYFGLRRQADSLAAENARLRMALRGSFSSDSNTVLLGVDTTLALRYHYVAARVVGGGTAKAHNYLTIGKGALHGIRERAAVLTGAGVVGFVRDVGPRFSTVVPVINMDFKLSATLDTTGYNGIVQWDGANPGEALLVDIPNHVKTRKGMRVLTTNFSGVFMEGLAVGTVLRVEGRGADGRQRIRVKLANDFGRLDHVQVVLDLRQAERDSVEARLPVGE